jgi:putative endopeptidase
MKLSLIISAILFSFLLIITGCEKQTVEEIAKYPALERKNLDTTVKPGDDFYQYANGSWMKNNPIPAELSRFGAFDEIQETNYKQLKDLLTTAADVKNSKKGSVEQLIGDFYTSGMDTIKIEKEGINPLKKEIELINNINDQKSLQNAIAHLNQYGIFPGFIMYAAQDDKNSSQIIANLYQGGLGLEDRDYYLSNDPRSQELRKEYRKHLKNIFKISAEKEFVSEEAAEKTCSEIAGKIMSFETQLAKASRTRVELRDPVKNYNKMSIAECQKLMPDFDWNNYLKIMKINVNEINIAQPEFLTAYNALIKSTPIDDWKLYLKWNLIHATAPYLSSTFVNENFHFYGTIISGKEQLKERWKRVLEETSSSLGEAVGQLYVKKYFPPTAKTKMLKLVADLKLSLGERIKNLTWMSPNTKEKALKKLNTMNTKIGYPEKWIDYSKVEISKDSYVNNVLNASAFLIRRDLDKIGKPVDRQEWHMTPQTVNAYYSPNMNEIVFPAAILQPPFFNIDADDAVNYAAIGTVIGHEMTHGFDDQGRMYDKEGNLKDWWTPEDAENFTKHVKVLVEQYNSFVAIDSMRINGELTLGENIADLGGITVSYNAWKMATKNQKLENLDGFTPQQRFFLSYAQIWRQNIRDQELMKRIKEDVHSPGKHRVLGILQNVPEFYEAFGVKEGDKMFISSDKRAIIW